MFKVTSIPQKFNTHKKRMRYLVKRIDKTCKKLSDCSGSDVKTLWRLGCELIVLSLLLKSMGINWSEFMDNTFPNLRDSTIEAAMSLTRINLDETPALSFAGESNLLKLLEISKGTRLPLYLLQNKIPININIKSAKEKKKFKLQIERLIESKTKQRKPKSKNAQQKIWKIYKGLRRYSSIIKELRGDNTVSKEITVNQLVDVIDELQILTVNIKKLRRKLKN